MEHSSPAKKSFVEDPPPEVPYEGFEPKDTTEEKKDSTFFSFEQHMEHSSPAKKSFVDDPLPEVPYEGSEAMDTTEEKKDSSEEKKVHVLVSSVGSLTLGISDPEIHSHLEDDSHCPLHPDSTLITQPHPITIREVRYRFCDSEVLHICVLNLCHNFCGRGGYL